MAEGPGNGRQESIAERQNLAGFTLKYTPLLYLAGVGFLLAGCAAPSTVGLANRSITSAEIHKAVRTNQARIRSVTAEGKLTVETPEIAQSASFYLNLQKPDSVMLRIEGPFGIEVGAAILTREEFLFYNILQNRVISGSTNSSNLSRILRVNLTFEDVLTLFCGGSFFADDAEDADDMKLDDDFLVLDYRQGGARRTYWVNAQTLLIQKVQLVDAEGKLLLEQRFSNHKPVEGTTIPFNVQVTQPKERRRVSIAYSDLQVNVPAAQFTINIPANAERVRLQ
ncbi:MAG: DUF4292 domain-containing protein [Ignavibacteriales bacterium]|nr:DUF4292 domain-containing protein [Ignavibacteriales bacterium]